MVVAAQGAVRQIDFAALVAPAIVQKISLELAIMFVSQVTFVVAEA